MTGAVVLVAIVLVLLKYWHYVFNPWTRNGQVRAEVVQITPRVSGPIIELAVVDNRLVRAGELLFAIDPRTFESSLAQATANLDQARDQYIALEKQVEAKKAQVEVSRAQLVQAESAILEIEAEIEKDKAEFERQLELMPQRATSQKSLDRAKAGYEISQERRKGAVASVKQAEAALRQAEADLAEAVARLGAPGDSNAGIRAALAAVEQAELNFEFTRVVAPVDGYVTNLTLRKGGHAVANQPALALVEADSFWVDAYFRETAVSEMHPGDEAIVTLMGYPDQPMEGFVDSLGWGIAQQDGTTGFELLPNVSPTFEWIRLAQRVPVRIHLDTLPEGVELRVGTTASVLVKAGSGSSEQQ